MTTREGALGWEGIERDMSQVIGCNRAKQGHREGRVLTTNTQACLDCREVVGDVRNRGRSSAEAFMAPRRRSRGVERRGRRREGEMASDL